MHRLIAAATAVLLVTLVGACGQRSPDSASADIKANLGGKVALGAAEIDVPKDSLSQDTTVTISRLAGAGPDIGTQTEDAFQYSVGAAALRSAVRLYLPRTGDPGDLPVLASLTDGGIWDVVAADSDGDRITADVPHLSTWFGFDFLGWLKGKVDVFTRSAQFLGYRAGAPSCPHQLSATAAELVYAAADKRAQPPLLVCADGSNTGDITLRVVNNRSYAITLFPSGLGGVAPGALQQAVDDYQIAKALQKANQIILPAGGSVALTLATNQPAGTLLYEPNVAATVALAAYHIAKDIAGDQLGNDALTLYDCATAVTNADSIAAISDEVVKCVGKLLKPALEKGVTLGGLFKVPKAIVERALASLSLAKEAVIPIADALADHFMGSAIDIVTLTRVARPTSPPATTPPSTGSGGGGSPPPTAQPNPVDRRAVTSYDRMQPGAPHHGYFQSAWQDFTAASNTITYLSATVGTTGATAGAPVAGRTLTLRLCTDQNCASILAEVHPTIVNYGETGADIGDVAVTPGAHYYIVWYQPTSISGATWVTYWWAGGSTVTTSDQMQAVARGYNR